MYSSPQNAGDQYHRSNVKEYKRSISLWLTSSRLVVIIARMINAPKATDDLRKKEPSEFEGRVLDCIGNDQDCDSNADYSKIGKSHSSCGPAVGVPIEGSSQLRSDS